MNDLELIKRIAEIEGVDLRFFSISKRDNGTFYVFADNGATRNINYLTDKALLWDLMVKYEVNINHADMYVFMTESDGGWSYSHVDYDDISDLPRAILECIVKSDEP